MVNNKLYKKQTSNKYDRTVVFKVLLILIGIILVARLFYVQIIRHDHYTALALSEHMKKFEIPATRGIVKLQDGTSETPIVLNEDRFDVYADPKYIDNADKTTDSLIGVLGGNKDDLRKKLSSDSRYVVLAKKLTKDQVERVKRLDLSGVDAKSISTRTYPQGSLASQVLGFVNDDNSGQYGIEQYFNKDLSGQAGVQKAITDIKGIPLAVKSDNILQPAKPGEDITLTIDIGMQRMVEDVLKTGVESRQAIKGSAIIMDINTGAIKAMANYPTYDPGQYNKVTDNSVFSNIATSGSWEPGSVMKPLLMGAAFTEGTLNPSSTYQDAGFVQVADRKITNSLPWGARTMSMQDIISKSLNTGAVFMLKSLGESNDVNEKARTKWYKYMTENYHFGQKSGVEIAGEADGIIAGPNEGSAVDVRYANTAFGQGVTVTPIQILAAYASLFNGGTFYKPTLLASTGSGADKKTNEPKVLKTNVVSSQASAQVREITKVALEVNNPGAKRAGYNLGAKSGTAQIAGDDGSYQKDDYNGVYIGYIGGDMPQYIMLVRLDEPKTSASGFASTEASKVWNEISNKLIDNFAVKPIKS